MPFRYFEWIRMDEANETTMSLSSSYEGFWIPALDRNSRSNGAKVIYDQYYKNLTIVNDDRK